MPAHAMLGPLYTQLAAPCLIVCITLTAALQQHPPTSAPPPTTFSSHSMHTLSPQSLPPPLSTPAPLTCHTAL
jgi:hypothetical protein